MGSQEVIVTLMITLGVSFILNIAFGGIVIWLRGPIFNTIKLRKLMSMGYGIIRLIKNDKTVIEKVMVLKPTLQIEKDGGLYTLDKEAVVLRDRKYPEFTFREGETSPFNYDNEFSTEDVECTSCKVKFPITIERPKSINPHVLDNVVLKAKTEGGLMKWLKENKQMLIYLMGVGAIALIGTYLIYDLRTNLPTMIADAVRPIIRKTAETATTILTTK